MRIKAYILIFSFAAVVSFAQGSSAVNNARTLSMGKSTVALANGVFSIGENPANLASPYEYNLEFYTVFPLPGFNIIGGNNILSINDLNKYFTGTKNSEGETVGTVLTDSDKQELVDLFSDSDIFANVSTTLLAFSYHHSKEVGSFGFSISDNAAVNASLPQSLVELAFFGNEINKAYSLEEINFKSSYTRQYSFTYARDISSMFSSIALRSSAGLSLKIISGYFYSDLERINSSFVTNDNGELIADNDLLMRVAASPDFGIEYDFEDIDKESSISPFPSPSGSGFGIDLGLNFELSKSLTVGIAVTDIGSMSWDTETVGYEVDSTMVITDFFEQGAIDSIENKLEPKGAYIPGFTSSLPTTLRLGASINMDEFTKGSIVDPLVLVINYQQGFNDAPGNTTIPLFTIGGEYRYINWLPLRTGFAFGGFDGFSWALGFGIGSDVFEFNLGASNVQFLFTESVNARFGLSASSRWRF